MDVGKCSAQANVYTRTGKLLTLLSAVAEAQEDSCEEREMPIPVALRKDAPGCRTGDYMLHPDNATSQADTKTTFSCRVRIAAV